MKGVSNVVWIAIALFFAAVLIGAIGYWFLGWWHRGGGGMSQTECQLKLQQACEKWRSAGFPTYIEERIFCKDNQPDACCRTRSDGWYTLRLSTSGTPSQWWQCIAPGCYENYRIYPTRTECGAA